MEHANMEERRNSREESSDSSEIEQEADREHQYFVYTSKTKDTDIPRETLTRLHVDSSVKEIPVNAFRDCEALVQVQLPMTLARIGESAFCYCPNLKCVQFISRTRNDPAKISSLINDSSTEDGSVVFPESLMLQVDKDAFSFCASLRKVIICSDSTKLGEGVFRGTFGTQGRSGLISVELPEGLQVIEPLLFSCCMLLTTIKIPSSVIKIGEQAFCRCSSLCSVDLPHGLLEIGAGSFQGCGSIESIRIPATVTSIGENGFRDCKALVHLQLPETLSRIGKAAFMDCPMLKCVQFFVSRNASSLENVSINDKPAEDGLIVFPERAMLQIEEDAFSRCRSLRKVVVCSISMKLCKGAFSDCHGLLSVELAEGHEVIEPDLFWVCRSLTTVKIPSSVIKIGDQALYGCQSLTRIDLPHGLREIGARSFQRCGSIESVCIPTTVSSIGESSFRDCWRLKQIELPPTLERIECFMFDGCRSLEYIEIPSTVSFIGDGAFGYCESLSHIRIPPSVDCMMLWPFARCNKLVSIELPEGILISNNKPVAAGQTFPCPSLVNLAIPTLPEDDESVSDLLYKNSRLGSIADGYDNLASRLKHRFDNSPMNKLCYYQTYHSSEEDLMAQLRSLVKDDPLAGKTQVDEFGMTPLHILSLSQTPNLDMLLALMNAGNAGYMVHVRDSFGSTPIDYLCLNRGPNSTEVIRRVVQTRFDSILGLNHHQQTRKIEMMKAVDEALAVNWSSSRKREIGRLLARFERDEIICVLELYLWKLKIFSAPRSAEKKEHHQIADRQSCRIHSGASIVIPHVLPFLNTLFLS